MGEIAIRQLQVAHVSLIPKGSESHFWQRNKDKIIMLAIGGIVTEAIHIAAALINK